MSLKQGYREGKTCEHSVCDWQIAEDFESWLPNNMETKLYLQERKQEEQFIIPLTDGLPGRAGNPEYMCNNNTGEKQQEASGVLDLWSGPGMNPLGLCDLEKVTYCLIN